MSIDILKIDKQLNDYAIDKLFDIIERYGKYFSNKQIEIFNNCIIKNRILVAERTSDKTISKFGENVPAACGPRSWEDGLIHVYPDKYPNLSDEEIIEHYKSEGIILHELFHYVIKMDFGIEENTEESDFGHYLTEGMVQLFTEIDSGHPFSKSAYRKNVEIAKQIFELIPTNRYGDIFRKNWMELSDNELNLEYFFEIYKQEKEFLKLLKPFIEKIAKKINDDPNKILSRMAKLSTEDTINTILDNIRQYFEDNEVEDLTGEFNEIVDSTIKKNKKRLL